MRRILRGEKTLDKSKEKQKQKDLLLAINRDKEQQGAIKSSIKTLSQELENLQKYHLATEADIEELTNELLMLQEQRSSLEGLIIPLQSQKSILEIEISSLYQKKADMAEVVAEEGKKTEAELRRLDEVKNKQHKKLHQEIVALEKKIADKEAELLVKTASEKQVAQSVADKKREKDNMDSSIARRMQELTQINLDIAENKIQAERAQRDLDQLAEKLESVKESIMAYDAQIEEKTALVEKAEADAIAKRNAVVQLVRREERLNELIPTIKDLYAKAGIKIDI